MVTPEHKKEVQRNWYQAHKEELQAKARIYRKKYYADNIVVERLKNREGHLKARLIKLTSQLAEMDTKIADVKQEKELAILSRPPKNEIVPIAD